jgi:hypothetical protein
MHTLLPNFFSGIKRCFLLFCIDVLNCRKLHKLVWFNSESKCKSYKEKEKTEKNKKGKKKKKRKERKWTEQPGLAQQQRPANRTERVTPSLFSPTDGWSPPASLTSWPHQSDPSSSPAVSSPPTPETARHDLPFPRASRDRNDPHDDAPPIPLLSPAQFATSLQRLHAGDPFLFRPPTTKLTGTWSPRPPLSFPIAFL